MSLCAIILTVLFLCGSDLVLSSDEEMSQNHDYVTATPDYDYNATFDYYYVTGAYEPGNQELTPWGDQAEAVSHLTSVLLLGLAAGQMI